jgi:hypothetical protein
LIFNFKALYENDAAPPNLNTIAYFRSFFPTISIEWIIYTIYGLSILSIYLAAGLANKKISFPFFPPPSLTVYKKRWLSTKGASDISPMQ